ncbi:MAG: hypothetical protein FJY67_03190 [Calditrichaeota bacterium]|nr:hypothetical protein [Calditrichota bacterium]
MNTPDNTESAHDQADKASTRHRKRLPRWLAGMGIGTLIFFTIKGIVTTSLIVGGGWAVFKGCF